MKYMGLNEIREKYLSFFESKGHLRAKSHSLVPENDNSLLLINSGMAPLKPYFTGIEVPPTKRMTTCQKCIRTGDIENVGKTIRHGTFFEMLGNFSFGDYFKEEIIPWSWEFCTEVMGLPAEKLYVSVYEEDDEAYNIWRDKVGLDETKIFRLGKDDNFWEVGLGPCGPCSEIHYDRGEEYGCGKEDCAVGCDCDRYMEFWNLVFTQFNKEEDGSYSPLAHPNIDTGMGLERMGVILQDVASIFDTDSIKAVRDKVCEISGAEYGKDAQSDVSIRIITDHIRSVTFMMADGVLPNNEGRGYVLRRLLRRAARHGKLLGIKEKFLQDLCKVVINEAKGAYPELLEKQDYILKLINVEESRFYETLDQGIEMLKERINMMRKGSVNIMPGAEAFKLYDTYGFPLELMKEILDEEHLGIDEDGFKKEMEHQRETARNSRAENTYMGAEDTVFNKLNPEDRTVFEGYDSLVEKEAQIKYIIKNDAVVSEAVTGDEVSVILDKTTFYAESGGQAGDKGVIETLSGKVQVFDCVKVGGNKFSHIGKVISGTIKEGERVTAFVDEKTRKATARNHTATHLLQKALRDVLGSHVEQAGSNVTADRLRFDFTHFEGLSDEELKQVEALVNEKIYDALEVQVINTTMDEAKKLGAMALFGEKYGSDVRVINIADYSIELCGGTHVSNTSQIGIFKILSESGVAAGVRRIEALTGLNAINYYNVRENILRSTGRMLKANPENLIEKAESFIAQMKDMRNEVEKLKQNLSGSVVDDIIKGAVDIKGVKAVIARIDDQDGGSLRNMGDQIKDKLQSGVLVLVGSFSGKANLVVMATEDIVKQGVHAGNIVKEVAEVIGGKGGGRPNMAQAGGKDVAKLNEAMDKAKEVIESML